MDKNDNETINNNNTRINDLNNSLNSSNFNKEINNPTFEKTPNNNKKENKENEIDKNILIDSKGNYIDNKTNNIWESKKINKILIILAIIAAILLLTLIIIILFKSKKTCIEKCKGDKICIEQCYCTSGCGNDKECKNQCSIKCDEKCNGDSYCLNECSCHRKCSNNNTCYEMCSCNKNCNGDYICYNDCMCDIKCNDDLICSNQCSCKKNCGDDNTCIDLCTCKKNCNDDSSCQNECSCQKDCKNDKTCIQECGCDLDCNGDSLCIEKCGCVKGCNGDSSCINDCNKAIVVAKYSYNFKKKNTLTLSEQALNYFKEKRILDELSYNSDQDYYNITLLINQTDSNDIKFYAYIENSTILKNEKEQNKTSFNLNDDNIPFAYFSTSGKENITKELILYNKQIDSNHAYILKKVLGETIDYYIKFLKNNRERTIYNENYSNSFLGNKSILYTNSQSILNKKGIISNLKINNIFNLNSSRQIEEIETDTNSPLQSSDFDIIYNNRN